MIPKQTTVQTLPNARGLLAFTILFANGERAVFGGAQPPWSAAKRCSSPSLVDMDPPATPAPGSPRQPSRTEARLPVNSKSREQGEENGGGAPAPGGGRRHTPPLPRQLVGRIRTPTPKKGTLYAACEVFRPLARAFRIPTSVSPKPHLYFLFAFHVIMHVICIEDRTVTVTVSLAYGACHDTHSHIEDRTNKYGLVGSKVHVYMYLVCRCYPNCQSLNGIGRSTDELT